MLQDELAYSKREAPTPNCYLRWVVFAIEHRADHYPSVSIACAGASFRFRNNQPIKIAYGGRGLAYLRQDFIEIGNRPGQTLAQGDGWRPVKLLLGERDVRLSLLRIILWQGLIDQR